MDRPVPAPNNYVVELVERNGHIQFRYLAGTKIVCDLEGLTKKAAEYRRLERRTARHSAAAAIRRRGRPIGDHEPERRNRDRTQQQR
jgi:hypothetical protein